MSLHRVIAPPPLALAVHPAPSPKTREEVKKEDEKRRADREAKAKVEADAKAALEAEKKGGDAGGKDKAGDKADKAAPPASHDKPSEPITATKTDPVEAAKPEKPLVPLRLLPPVPHRPLRSRLDLNPIRPYPPINTDPRGAYTKYAKAISSELIHIDLTRDGWLNEQWRERNEREALARLTGEAENQRLREVAKAKQANVVRKVPGTAEGLILELWNDLVEAESQEMSVESFWAKYDWSDPKAERHLQLMPAEEKAKAKAAQISRLEKEAKVEEEARLAARAIREKEKEEEKRKKDAAEAEQAGDKEGADKGEEKEKDNQAKVKVDAEKKSEEVKVPAAPVTVAVKDEKKGLKKEKQTDEKKEEVPVEPTYQYPLETEWTREGVEEVLATIGVQCAFNTEKPLPRHWSTPDRGYLLLSHGHFLLRIEADIEFKPDGTTDKFEALVTSANDRVFGKMVLAQAAAERKKKEKEYRDRKEREHRERKDKERKEKGDKEGNDAAEEAKQAKDGDEKIRGKDGGKPDRAHDTAAHPHRAHKDKDAAVPGTHGAQIVHHTGDKADVAIVAVPVKEKVGLGLDEKHEEEAELVGPKVEDLVAAQKKKDADAQADKEKHDKKADDDKAKKAAAAAAEAKRAQRHKEAAFDPVRDADLIVKMLGPEAANIPLADLKAAFAAMEEAAVEQKARAHMEKKEGPMIWVWHEKCERWRWRNFAAGCAVIEPGGWEERDWKVFADDRGMEVHHSEMEWAEVIEADIHDWSC